MIEVNKFKIGIFIIAGIIVALGAIFLFGGSDLFNEEVKLVTVYDESVQGLEKGSQVKFRGVPVGKVTEIAILQSDSKIRIKMEIDPSAFVPHRVNSAEIMVNSNSNESNDLKMFIKQQIKNGLQVRMEFAGITGFKYVELNYFNAPSDKLLPEPTGLAYDEIYIAAAPSILSDAVHNISKSLENISKIRFDKISASLENSAAKINEFLDDDTFQSTVANLKNITAKLDRAISEEKLGKLLDDIQKATNEIQFLAAKVNAESNISQTTNSIRNAGIAVSNTSETLENTLYKLDTTLDKLSVLLNLLNENPSALIRGKEAKVSEIK